MEADMKTSNLINNLVLVDAILTMSLGLGLGLTAPALVLGGLVPLLGVLLSLFLLATGVGPMFKGADKVENNDPLLVAAEKADAGGRMVYLGVTIAAIVTLALGIGANKTELALMVGGLVPIGGLILAIVALVGDAAGGKGEAEALTNFTSFSPAEEQTFVVFERTSLEIEKRASRIALISVVSVGVLFAIYAPRTVGISRNEDVVADVAVHPDRFYGMASLRVDRWNAEEATELAHLRAALGEPGIVGIKLAHAHQQFRMDDPRYFAIYALAAELGAEGQQTVVLVALEGGP